VVVVVVVNKSGTQQWQVVVVQLALLLTAAVGLCLPTAANAWVQYRTKAGCGLRWPATNGAVDGPVAVTVATDDRGLQGVEPAKLQEAVVWATGQWQQIQCGVVDVLANPPTATAPLGVQFELAGAVKAPPIGACASPNPDGTCAAIAPNGNVITTIANLNEWTYGSFLFGLTVLTYREADGAIVDGDILLNDAQYDFCAGDCALGTTALCNTLTHEVGHLLGLDHGQVKQSTMYANAGSGDVNKCTLHGDDEQGACWAYRHDCTTPLPPEPPKATTSKESSGCLANPRGKGKTSVYSALGVAVVAVVFALRRRGAGQRRQGPTKQL
jgi:hypothetical protein